MLRFQNDGHMAYWVTRLSSFSYRHMQNVGYHLRGFTLSEYLQVVPINENWNNSKSDDLLVI